jgi:hypothetical protein
MLGNRAERRERERRDRRYFMSDRPVSLVFPPGMPEFMEHREMFWITLVETDFGPGRSVMEYQDHIGPAMMLAVPGNMGDRRIQMAPFNARPIGGTEQPEEEKEEDEEWDIRDPTPFGVRVPGSGMEICLYLIINNNDGTEGHGLDIDVVLWNIGDAGPTPGLGEGWTFGVYLLHELVNWHCPMCLADVRGSLFDRPQALEGAEDLERQGSRLTWLRPEHGHAV